MGLIYRASDKEILAARKRIMLEKGIPALIELGFARSPYRTAWFGYDSGIHAYSYELCRLRDHDLLECVELMALTRERWIQIRVNVFRLHPAPGSMEALTGLDGLQFTLSPNNHSRMRLRIDDRKGPPILRWLFGEQHRLGFYCTRKGFERRVKELSALIERDMKGVNGFLDRWHQLHEPMDVDLTGHAMEASQT